MQNGLDECDYCGAREELCECARIDYEDDRIMDYMHGED